MQSRRASPRIPYDEAVCLTPADASGRIYGRGLDLGTGGMFLVCCAESARSEPRPVAICCCPAVRVPSRAGSCAWSPRPAGSSWPSRSSI